MYVAILGRQPAFGVAELESRYGADAVSWHSDLAARIETAHQPDVQALGGSQKIGKVILNNNSSNWRQLSTKIVQHYLPEWQFVNHKITFGISAYGLKVSARDVQNLAVELKKRLRAHNVSLRVVPNSEPALNTATSHHNKLGLSPNKVELLLVGSAHSGVLIAESCGAQNITALAARDQARPSTDAFVGMLPPKLALMMLNIATGLELSNTNSSQSTILDPFCGTGVVLQEALLRGHPVSGSDLSEKMVMYSTNNLEWLSKLHPDLPQWQVEQGDAMTHTWQAQIDAVVSETYLGQPFSAPPSPAKLRQVVGNCDHIISSFLNNIHPQLKENTPLCIAVPAWRDNQDRFTKLPLINNLERLGYRQHTLRHVRPDQLLYYRPDQVVARQLLILRRSS